MEDHLIVSLFWDRSEAAITETSLKYGKYCKSIAQNILQNNEDADECINDTYMSLWNSIPPQKPVSFRAYLAKITRNHSLNKYKQKTALKRSSPEMNLIFDELAECLPSASSTEAEYEMNLLAEHINDFLRTLAEESQIIFVRRYWYSDSILAIATKLRISESKVKSILYRCREKLRQHLEREEVAL